MSSAVNIQIVSMPNLAKIESFLKDVSYRETIEYSANFNTRLCSERRHRLPFLDPQTGVAQNHSQLFLDKRQRMPGFRQGQIYTYPAARWRKSRRQYLSKMYSRFPERPFQALRKEHEALVASGVNLGLSSLTSGMGSMPGSNSLASSSSLTLNMLTGGGAAPAVLGSLHSDTAHDFNGAFSLEESSSLGAAGGDTSDSKDSQQQQHQQQQHQHQQQAVKEEHLPKEWFYDELDINDVDSLEEPKSPADDEYDYDPRYGNKKRRKRRPGKRGGDSGVGGGGGGAGGGGNSGASSSSRRRSAAARSRITTTDAALDASLEAIESGESVPGSNGGPISSGGILSGSLGAGLVGVSGSGGGGGASGASANSRRSRGAGTRGRRRTKGPNSVVGSACDPTSPGMVIEPPSFESAAAAVGVVEDANAHLRNYRKYL
ncbi:putative lysozyme-like protein [Drosophila erecta]|uniref:DPF1-3 N-terminal domain-containing protein n=1 Tax=Drosophila erecta TaxID=7220 RepID=B3NWL7_DROER|nr:putative lysozyme-like protein [Drosophila erecta]EDV47179.1 uncharacterized protein Dere_GG19497 [Drosophila erecta]